jgi:NAD(P)-dependent dehydrogenase (short-subunit alcohol dehydrogenase family)
MSGRLDGKTAIVTGGASGFGAGIARRFAAEGARVMVADIDPILAEEIAAQIGGLVQVVDVASNDSVAALAEAARAPSAPPTFWSTTPASPTCRNRWRMWARPNSTACWR